MANDFHFNIHVGLLVVSANELWEVKMNEWSVKALTIAILQSILALATRGSYSIDIAAAWIFGFFFWLIGARLSYYIDVLVLGNCL